MSELEHKVSPRVGPGGLPHGLGIEKIAANRLVRLG